jgi:hypothetical protein
MMVSRYDICSLFINTGTSSAGPTNVSGSSPSSTSPNTFAMNLALATADKAVKSIYPFFKELSESNWWTDLLAAWIDFEAKGPPKSVGFFYILFTFVFNL